MTDPIATTTGGDVRGITRDGVHVFRSIPYAAPPVGSRRFRPPQPVEGWSELRDATHFGPVAPQTPSMLETMMGAQEPVIDEAGCLTLSVFTPALDDAKRPVLFWIHGGAFVIGTGSTPIYDGRRFATHGDVVVVSINYRLGAFGFLHLEEIFGSDFAGSGNLGILDQVCALEWVRDNIASFGGDPDRVTIFGESAGGMSVGTLLGLPAAQGLFSQAIVQSGGGSFCATAETATSIAGAVLAEAGIDTVAELESAPMDAILAAQTKTLAARASTDLAFIPVVDGTVLPERPVDAVAHGLGAVPTLIGTTKDEMTLFTVLDLGLGELDGDAVNRALGGELRRLGQRRARSLPRAAPGPRRPGSPHGDRDRSRLPRPGDPPGRGRPRPPPHVHVPVHVGDAGVRRHAQELPCARAAVHVGRDRQARPVDAHGRRARAPAARRRDARGLDRVRPHRRSRMAGVRPRAPRDPSASTPPSRPSTTPKRARRELWAGIG